MQESFETHALGDGEATQPIDRVGVSRLPITARRARRTSWCAVQLAFLVALTGALFAVASGIVLGGVFYMLSSLAR